MSALKLRLRQGTMFVQRDAPIERIGLIHVPDIAKKHFTSRGFVTLHEPSADWNEGTFTGQYVYFEKFSGQEFEIEGKKLLLVNEADVLAVEERVSDPMFTFHRERTDAPRDLERSILTLETFRGGLQVAEQIADRVNRAPHQEQTMLTKAEFELLLDTIRLRESDTSDAREQNTLIRIHTKLEGNQALLIRNKEHRMTVQEAINNAKESVESYLKDNGYELTGEIQDEATFADELESACSFAAEEYRKALSDEDESEDEDGGDAADAAEVSRQIDEGKE